MRKDDADIQVTLHALNMAVSGGMIDLSREVAADNDRVNLLALEIAAIRNGRLLEEAFDLSEEDLDAACQRLPEDVTRSTCVQVAAAIAFRATQGET